jgi:hypothetical protein
VGDHTTAQESWRQAHAELLRFHRMVDHLACKRTLPSSKNSAFAKASTFIQIPA